MCEIGPCRLKNAREVFCRLVNVWEDGGHRYQQQPWLTHLVLSISCLSVIEMVRGIKTLTSP